MAEKEAPSIDIPALIDCKSCWVGDVCETILKVRNNGGEAAFRFFSEENENASSENGDFLAIGDFRVEPREFYVQKNSQINVRVLFAPKKEGITHQKLSLACDNNTSAEYML